MSENPSWIASQRFDEAFALARFHHRLHARKVDHEPYIGHLLGVSSLIIEYGGDEDQAIAGLLHDLVEDTDVTIIDIASRFGSRIADLVDKCTEATKKQKDQDKTMSNYQELRRARKQRYLDALASKSKDDPSILVALADKVNNAEKTSRDIVTNPNLFDNFNAGLEEQKWWYQSLVAAFAGLKDSSPRDKLLERFNTAVDRIVCEIDKILNEAGSPAKKGST